MSSTTPPTAPTTPPLTLTLNEMLVKLTPEKKKRIIENVNKVFDDEFKKEVNEEKGAEYTQRRSMDPLKRKIVTPSEAGTVEQGSVIDMTMSEDSEDDKEIVHKQKSPKNDYGLFTVEPYNTNAYLKGINSNIAIVPYVKRETADWSTYFNGIDCIHTAVIMAGKDVNGDSLANIPNIKDISLFRSLDITNYLEDNGVTLMKFDVTVTYDKIMTSQNDSNPILLEYSVQRHHLEDARLPKVWVQLVIFLREENLIIPFNATGQNIKLGNQFKAGKWKTDFNSYAKDNLHKRIAPVVRTDKQTHLRNVVRELEFRQAWSMPIPSE
jgi:hypothetical protein